MSTEEEDKKVSFEDLEIETSEKVLPTTPSEAVAINLEEEKPEKRKLFANKRANIALIAAGAVIVLGIVGVIVFILI